MRRLTLSSTRSRPARDDNGNVEWEEFDERERNRTHSGSSSMRRSKYKDKFYSMREKYDAVKMTNNAHLKDLANAESKLRKLQAECDFLLDTIALSARKEPSLAGFMARSPSPQMDDEGRFASMNGHDDQREVSMEPVNGDSSNADPTSLYINDVEHSANNRDLS